MENILHVYGQEATHDDVMIVGNEQALITIIELAREALSKPGERISEKGLFTNDGEEFTLYVKFTNDEKELSELAAPFYGDWI